MDSAIPHPFILVGVKVRSALSNSTSESDSESEEMMMALDLSIATAASFFQEEKRGCRVICGKCELRMRIYGCFAVHGPVHSPVHESSPESSFCTNP